MRLNNGLVGVEFDMSHNTKYKVGDVEIVRPELWEFEDSSYSQETKYQKNTNLKETNPQIAVVTVEGNGFEVGEKVFVHYLSINNASDVREADKVHKVISGKSVFFKIGNDGEYEMMEDVYLGQQVYIEALRTESGIYLTSHGEKKDSLKVKLTHVPKNSPYFKVGDTVVTVDEFQYEIDLYGKKHVKLNTWDIAVAIEE